MIGHVCLPRKYRTLIVINLKLNGEVNFDSLRTVVQNSIRKACKSSVPLFMSFERNTSSNQVTVVYFDLPNELCRKLMDNGLKKCMFYICDHEDVHSVPVLESPPLNVAKTNDDNKELPYKSGCVTLEFSLGP